MSVWRTALASASLAAAAMGQAPALAAAAAAQQNDEVSCRVCHPGPTRGLAESAHGVLLQRPELQGKVCSSCHGDLADHATERGQNLLPRKPVAKVASASCTSCHADRHSVPLAAAHPLRAVGSGMKAPPPPEADLLRDLQRGEEDRSLVWSGFAELGYRFVHQEGSVDAYSTDVDLEPGVRLREFEVRGRGNRMTAVDDLALRGHDIGDPRWDLDLSAAKTDVFDLGSTYRDARYLYAATGDYHRVDRNARRWDSTLGVGLGEGWRAFGSYARREEDGFWLTQRIGDRNLPVQTVVDGVASPRSLQGDSGEVGVTYDGDAWSGTVAVGYLDERTVDRWSYSMPATANPGFVEAEDFASRGHLRGPSGRLQLGATIGAVAVELSAQYLEHQRDIDASGTGSGFDVAAYTTETSASGDGRSQTLLSQADVTWNWSDSWRLVVGARWRDHTERTRLDQTDVKTTPSLGTVVTVDTDVDDETVQRLFEADFRVQWSPVEQLELSVGYGFAEEQLRVPDLQPADPLDFRRGHRRDEGLLAGFHWRPGEDWSLRGEGRAFAQDGLPLHEIEPEQSQLATGSLEWSPEPWRAALFARHRRNENDVSQHRLDTYTTGVNGGLTRGSTTWTAGYTFTDIDTQTLTNFYFDPDPDPSPTLVGFQGKTHSWTLSAVASLHDSLRLELAAVRTRTVGSYDVDTVDLRADLQLRLTASGAAGVEWRRMSYDDEAGVDDWRADIVFVYWRCEW